MMMEDMGNWLKNNRKNIYPVLSIMVTLLGLSGSSDPNNTLLMFGTLSSS